jgi:hypothetical protein
LVYGIISLHSCNIKTQAQIVNIVYTRNSTFQACSLEFEYVCMRQLHESYMIAYGANCDKDKLKTFQEICCHLRHPDRVGSRDEASMNVVSSIILIVIPSVALMMYFAYLFLRGCIAAYELDNTARINPYSPQPAAACQDGPHIQLRECVVQCDHTNLQLAICENMGVVIVENPGTGPTAPE